MAIILCRNIPTTNSLLAKIKHFSESDMRKLGYDGSRHPGHQDQENLLEFENALLTEPEFVPKKLGKVVLFDTTSPDPVRGFGDLIAHYASAFPLLGA